MKGIKQVAVGLMLIGLSLAVWAHHHEEHEQAPVCAGNQVDCAPVVMTSTDAKGNLWRLYPTDDGLFVQQRLASNAFAAPLLVTTEKVLLGAEQRPQLAFGPQQQMYVVWSVQKDRHWTCDTRFAAAADGKNFTSPVTVNRDNQQTTHCFPTMKTNSQGDIFIAWLDRSNHLAAEKADRDYKGMALHYSWSTDGGRHFAAKDITLEDETCECCRIAMTLNNDLPLIAFRKIYPGMERDHALVQLTALDMFNPAERITFERWELNGCPEQGPALLQANKHLHFMWFDKGQLFYKQRVDGQWSEPQVVGKKGGEHPDLLATSDAVYRVWRQYSKGAMRVFAQTSKNQGASWSDEVELAATQNGSDYPYLVKDNAGVWLSWKTDDEGHLLIPLSGEQ